ncbi:TetR/AcrR family transcriptional regulator [Solidesulfovibrio alcoholivorans]|uniref:TetR/AcrR family transcriptional regulator n=1 Tax=Solidesulfovibrio alcoholivorans TaxID=81406 RepID=UPI000694DC16|nr:TetR/AcrR family transcriptional regulator [Solidesulfovibrio alcoholivorans]
MGENHKRKKQPRQVRERVLEAAAQVIVERGLGGLTLELAARRAGISKGGLMHHFPSKQALLDGIFRIITTSFESAILACTARDDNPHGRFTRAYVAATFAPRLGEYDNALLGACGLAMSRDAALSGAWHAWVEAQLAEHGEDPENMLGRMLRYAADGMWLEHCGASSDRLAAKRKAMAAYLMELSQEL